MPAADVGDLEVQPALKRLFAAMFGRGLFMVQTDVMPSRPEQ